MKLLRVLDELRALAQKGSNFADNEYDRERYQRMEALVAECYGEAFEIPPADIRERLVHELGQLTPKVTSSALIRDDAEQVLLMERLDTETWCLPGGAVEIGESPAACATRETPEETGLESEVTGLALIAESPSGEDTPWHTIQHIYEGRRTGGNLEASEREVSDLGFRPVEAVDAWSMNHREIVTEALAQDDPV